MLIPRPTHNDFLYRDTPTTDPVVGDTSKHCAWVNWFFSLTPWKCHVCGAMIVATCDYCVCCKYGPYRRYTPRPTDAV